MSNAQPKLESDLLDSLRDRLRFHFGTQPGADLSFDAVQRESVLQTRDFRLACTGEVNEFHGDRLFCDASGMPTDAELAKLGAINRTLDNELVAGLTRRAHMRVAREIEQR